MKPVTLILLAVLLCAGCAGMPHSGRAPAGPPPDDTLDAVLWTQRAVEHDLVFREIYRAATERLSAALADPGWQALVPDERTATSADLPPAVILDIDETVLDNSPYQARLIRKGRSYDEASWAAWCREAAAQALPGALEFTREAARRGVTVFYVSNRAQDLDTPTLANLRALGFPLARGEPVFLGRGTAVPGCAGRAADKGCRRRLVGAHHRVLMQFGDQIGDFTDVATPALPARAAAMAPWAHWIGARWFVLPNPVYGSWETAAFGNDWQAAPGLRRRAKIAALDTR
jgi:acid phosphatase